MDTASEALAVSIGERAVVDLPFMAALADKTEDDIIKELAGVIFQNPLTDKWETSDEYLSGNVREKLQVAKDFAENHPEYEINVEYLTKIQPKDLEASEIEIRLGATWVDQKYINDFMKETFHTPNYYLGKTIDVKYAEINGQWNISGKMRTLGIHWSMQPTEPSGQMLTGSWRMRLIYVIQRFLIPLLRMGKRSV